MSFNKRISKFLVSMAIGSCILSNFNCCISGMESKRPFKIDYLDQAILDYNTIVTNYPSYELSTEEINDFYTKVATFVTNNKGISWNKSKFDDLCTILECLLFSFLGSGGRLYGIYQIETNKLDDFMKKYPNIRAKNILDTIKSKFFDRGWYIDDLNYNCKISCRNNLGLKETSNFINFVIEEINVQIGKKKTNDIISDIENLYVILWQLSQKLDEFKERYIKENFSSCPICYENLNDIDIATLNCGHSMCKNCLSRMSSNMTRFDFNCPSCRQKFTGYKYRGCK
jgi:hypothetical protein